ncbi:MAG: hypothetical protein ACRCV0_05760 [Brevinema sp.]
MIFLFALLTLLPLPNFGFIEYDTLSIKGTLIFKNTELMGDFWYTLKNNSDTDQNSWTVFVNHSVNVLSIQQDGQEAPISIQNGTSFRAISIKLPKPLKPHTRSSVFIKFSLLEQNNDPRFIISSNYVFLDSRKLWFPYPNNDHDVSSEITIETPKELYSILGSKLYNDAVIINNRLSTWKNELPKLSPSMSLIITDQPRKTQKFLNIYTTNNEFSEFLFKKLEPFWDLLITEHKEFPLSEIHIFPSDISLEAIVADGEFLGNLFLLDKKMLDQYLIDPNSLFFESGSINQRIIETMIHELYHSYFPGQITYSKEDRLFLESFTQYLTWDLIHKIEPSWAQKIYRRSRFLLQNMLLTPTTNETLSYFILETSKLFAALNNYHIDSFKLTDTLVEKYRFVEMSKQDIINTIIQFDELQTNKINPNHLAILSNTNTASFNVSLKVDITNFNVIITNKKRTISIPVQNNSIDISHNLESTWHGSLFLVNTNKSTNSIRICIPHHTLWETNIIGNIDEIFIQSSLDLLETDLSDNTYKTDNDIGIKMINQLNAQVCDQWDISDKHLKILQQFRKFKWKWDQTIFDQNKYYISAFLQDENNKNISFVIIEIETTGKIDDIKTLL